MQGDGGGRGTAVGRKEGSRSSSSMHKKKINSLSVTNNNISCAVMHLISIFLFNFETIIHSIRGFPFVPREKLCFHMFYGLIEELLPPSYSCVCKFIQKIFKLRARAKPFHRSNC